MPLTPLRDELSRLDFEIASDTPDGLSAHRGGWHWDLMFTRLDWFVFVEHVPILTREHVEERLAGVNDAIAPMDPKGFPPRGFQRVYIAVPVFIADEVTPEAIELLNREPVMRIGLVTVAGALDRSSGTAHFLRKTPLWGWIFFSRIHHLLGRLLEADSTAESAPRSTGGIILSTTVFLLLAYLVFSVLLVVLAVVGAILMAFLVLVLAAVS